MAARNAWLKSKNFCTPVPRDKLMTVKIIGPKRYRPITTYAMELACVNTPGSPFYYRDWVSLPRANWGLPGVDHETDLLCLKRNEKKLVEIEIKISTSDFLADFKKGHHHESKIISALYYAVPAEIAEYCLQKIPERAGLISVDYEERGHMVRPAVSQKSNPPGDICVQRIYHYIAMRYWSERQRDTRREHKALGPVQPPSPLGQIVQGNYLWTISHRNQYGAPSEAYLKLQNHKITIGNLDHERSWVSVRLEAGQYDRLALDENQSLEAICDKAILFYFDFARSLSAQQVQLNIQPKSNNA